MSSPSHRVNRPAISSTLANRRGSNAHEVPPQSSDAGLRRGGGSNVNAHLFDSAPVEDNTGRLLPISNDLMLGYDSGEYDAHLCGVAGTNLFCSRKKAKKN